MKKYIIIGILAFPFYVHTALAQVDNLKMADIREINYNMLKLIDQYEMYSSLYSSEDFTDFKQLFSDTNTSVYCDVLNDARLDDMVSLADYLDIVKRNYTGCNVLAEPLKFSLPDIKGNDGTAEADLLKIVSGTNQCSIPFQDTFHLVFSIHFQKNNDNYTNFKIFSITNPTPRGKLVVFKFFNPRGKAMSGESFQINDVTKSTDIKGNMIYYYINQNNPLDISPLNKDYTGDFRFENFQELLAHRLPETDPCKPVTVELSVQLAPVVIAVIPPKEKKQPTPKKTAKESKSPKEVKPAKEVEPQDDLAQAKKTKPPKEVKPVKKVEPPDDLAQAKKTKPPKEAKPHKEPRTPAENAFALGAGISYILPLAGSPVSKQDEILNNKIEPSLSLGGGIIVAWEFKLGPLGKFQLQSGVNYENINFTSTLDIYAVDIPYYVDPENHKYVRMIRLNQIYEKIEMNYLSIPLAIEKLFPLGTSGWAITLDAGVHFMMLLNATYQSTASATYSGYYKDLCDITFNENGIYDFGYYELNNSKNLDATSFLLSADFGAGFTKKFNDKLSIFAKFKYRLANKSVFEKKEINSLSENYSQLESMMNYKDIYTLGYYYITLGISFKL